MIKAAVLVCAVLAAAWPLRALRPSDQMKSTQSKAVWMTVSSLETGDEYYMEVAQDGRAMLREETSRAVRTKAGTIPVQLIKDLLRETENSEIIITRNIKRNKTVFYRGELIRISAYISGELTLTEAPLPDFGEAFLYAFEEAHKAVLKLPVAAGVTAFLRAEPLAGEALDAFREQAGKDGEVKNIETSDIRRVKPLMAAIKDAYRLIPLEGEAAARELQDFLTKHQLFGLRTLFYLPSTRGTFKCSVIEAEKRAPAVPGGKKAAPARPANKAARVKKG